MCILRLHGLAFEALPGMSEQLNGPHAQELSALATRLRNIAQHFPSPQREQVADTASILKQRAESLKTSVRTGVVPRSAA